MIAEGIEPLDLPALPPELAALEAEGLARIRAKEEREAAARRAAEEAAARRAAEHWEKLLALVRADLPAALHPYVDSEAHPSWSHHARRAIVLVRLPGRAPIWLYYQFGEEAGWQREQPAKFHVLIACSRYDPDTAAYEVYWRADNHCIHTANTLAGAMAYAAIEGRRHAQLVAQGEQPEPVAVHEDDGSPE